VLLIKEVVHDRRHDGSGRGAQHDGLRSTTRHPEPTTAVIVDRSLYRGKARQGFDRGVEFAPVGATIMAALPCGFRAAATNRAYRMVDLRRQRARHAGQSVERIDMIPIERFIALVKYSGRRAGPIFAAAGGGQGDKVCPAICRREKPAMRLPPWQYSDRNDRSQH